MAGASAFLEAVDARLVLGDGGLGIRLGGTSDPDARPVPELNLTHPEAVVRVHREFADAGAEVLETNTFAAARSRLRPFGLEGRLREINLAGARLAREAAGPRRFVAGSVGPGGGAAGVGEQCEALAEGGCDLIVLETFTDAEELVAACGAALRTGLPVSCQMAGGDGEAFKRLIDRGASMVGVNCIGPDEAIGVLERARPAGARVAAWPSAGLPLRVGDRWVHPVRPEAFGAAAARLAELGVRLLGGCCGTGPEHLRAAAARLKAGSSR